MEKSASPMLEGEGREREGTTSGTYMNGERESNMGILVHMKMRQSVHEPR